MCGRVGGFFLLSFLLLASCGKEPVNLWVVPDVVEKGDTARTTLLVYVMAENSLSNYASLDVEEIVEAVPGLPLDSRLFVFVDDDEFPMLTHYFRLSNGEAGNSNMVLFGADVCSSDTAALGTVLDYILKDYPTKNLDLVLWSHGSGWQRAPLNSAPQRSIGVDNGENSFSNSSTKVIEIEELAALLKRLPVRVGRLMFDACFMQCVECCYALRGAAEWIIASPAEIPAEGAQYSTLVPCFFASEGAEDILEAYIEAYKRKYAGVVLSAVRTEGLQHLADVTYAYVIKYLNCNRKRDYADVFSYLPGGKYNGSPAYPSYFDMNAVMKKYLTAEEYARWRGAFDAAVAYVSASPKWFSEICGNVISYDSAGCGGISMYLPQHHSRNENFNSDFKSTEWYLAAGWQAAGW